MTELNRLRVWTFRWLALHISQVTAVTLLLLRGREDRGGVEGQYRAGGDYVTDRRRLGVLLPETGLWDPDVSSSSVDDHEDKSYQENVEKPHECTDITTKYEIKRLFSMLNVDLCLHRETIVVSGEDMKLLCLTKMK